LYDRPIATKCEDLEMNNAERIEHLVTAAAQDTSGDPRVQLFRALDGVEVFYSATAAANDRHMLSTPLRRLNDGSSALVVYTSKRHPDLPERFVGAQWQELLNIAYEAVRADWLVVVNRNNDTVAVAREQIPIIIADLQSSRADHLIGSFDRAAELEKIISSSAHTTSEEWYEPALIHLRGRELYLHLTDVVSPDGQPSMRTSTAAGRDGWIETYTTRRRPGIRYGGIAWEELVKMIKNDSEIPGVRVVNDADDWIVLGRDVI
jgi:hypothetical protein